MASKKKRLKMHADRHMFAYQTLLRNGGGAHTDKKHEQQKFACREKIKVEDH